MVPGLEEVLDRVFATAIEHGLDLDFHADETADVSAISLKKIAEAALRHRFEGKILVGHCCSLARQPDADVLDTLDKVARAGIAVVSLPMCNLYLQDRRRDGPPTSCGYMGPEFSLWAVRRILLSSEAEAGRNCCRGPNRIAS
jgi:cytosine deaminase